jgi:hypothetical protein
MEIFADIYNCKVYNKTRYDVAFRPQRVFYPSSQCMRNNNADFKHIQELQRQDWFLNSYTLNKRSKHHIDLENLTIWPKQQEQISICYVRDQRLLKLFKFSDISYDIRNMYRVYTMGIWNRPSNLINLAMLGVNTNEFSPSDKEFTPFDIDFTYFHNNMKSVVREHLLKPVIKPENVRPLIQSFELHIRHIRMAEIMDTLRFFDTPV